MIAEANFCAIKFCALILTKALTKRVHHSSGYFRRNLILCSSINVLNLYRRDSYGYVPRAMKCSVFLLRISSDVSSEKEESGDRVLFKTFDLIERIQS